MPAFDPLTYRYASRRNVVYAKNAVACTSVPLGAQIGLDVMKSGGSAVDAAVAMAAAMPLLEPTGNGLGSDCFALVWIERDKRLYGLNASGVAPMALSAEKVRAMGYTEMPKAGWLPTMVPGAPAGWAELNRRFGTKPLAELFAPAISYAEEGYPVPVNVARQWERDSRRIAKAMAENAVPHEYWWKSFIKPDGTPYRAGELFRFPDYDEDLHKVIPGCSSHDFMRKDEMLIPFERLHRAYEGRGLAQALTKFDSPADRIAYTVGFVERVTNLTGVGAYLTAILELDCLTLNEDRHTNNLAVLRNEETKEFRLCPIFDNGLSLLSDLNDYPLTDDLYTCIERVQAKPFDSDHVEQVTAAEQLYGRQLTFRISHGELRSELNLLSEAYSPDILQRAERVLLEQKRKHSWLF